MNRRRETRIDSHLDGAGVPVEQVGHVDLVLLVLVAVGEDVGALDGLLKVAKDVVDDDNGLVGVGGTGDVCKQIKRG